MTIVLSVFFRFTASDYPFDVSKLFFFPSNIWGFLIFIIFAEHSTHFQVGGDNPKVKGGSRKLTSIRDAIPLNQFTKQSHSLLSLWHFHFWKQSSRGKNVIRRAMCPVHGCCGNDILWYFNLYKKVLCLNEKLQNYE